MQNNSFIDEYNVFLNNSTVQNVPVIMTNPCGTPPSDLCVEEATYTQSLCLFLISFGYAIVWQRCCRNPTITNLQNFGGADNPGMTSVVTIPGTTDIGNVINSSPVFKSSLRLLFVQTLSFSSTMQLMTLTAMSWFILSALLLMEVQQMTLCPIRHLTQLPPVPYETGFSAGYPIASDPAFEIDPVTGFITGTPTMPIRNGYLR